MSYPHLYLIGLTGNIACGKSSVVAHLQKLGAHTLDADQVTRQLQEPGQTVYKQIVEHFGTGILSAPNGPIDRKALGNIVFSDPAQLKQLEALVHPEVRRSIHAWLSDLDQQAAAAQQPSVALIDAIKLLESGWKAHCNAIWVVTCRPEQQAERLIANRGMSEAEAWQRINAQPPQAEKIAQADVVIDNSGSLDATYAQIEAAWAMISL
jgi:dephospho-CoA kinase